MPAPAISTVIGSSSSFFAPIGIESMRLAQYQATPELHFGRPRLRAVV